MKLISFSVENYRSITTARKIPLSDYSILVGANNEGKSNILHALTLAMNALVEWQRQVRRTSDGRLIRQNIPSLHMRYIRNFFKWETDFPVSKQRKNKISTTNIILEFELSEFENQQFKETIGSNLNGSLPILISFGRDNFDVSVKKQGRGQSTLNKKSTRIADFVSKRIRFDYIPSIRTADVANKVVHQLIEKELTLLNENQEYSRALKKIEELEQPILDELAGAIQNTVSNFLPNIKSVKFNNRGPERSTFPRRPFEILINDGQSTKLERKGDGVQSLVALAMMRHISEQKSEGVSTVVAIEEPESHLHPRAIHELKSVIEALAANNQVVLTSHSPLFISPTNLESTIIVKGSKAASAKNIAEIRETLGVKISDNLQNARIVLLLEGSLDAISLSRIIPKLRPKLDVAIKEGILAIDHLGGANALIHKASFYQSGACLIQCFLDDDQAGRAAALKAYQDKILSNKDINLCVVPNKIEAELEDLYDVNIYGSSFQKEFGVDISKPKKSIKLKKWSSRVEHIFKQHGKMWNDDIKTVTKLWLANFASQHPENIVHKNLSKPLTNCLDTIEEKLNLL